MFPCTDDEFNAFYSELNARGSNTVFFPDFRKWVWNKHMIPEARATFKVARFLNGKSAKAQEKFWKELYLSKETQTAFNALQMAYSKIFPSGSQKHNFADVAASHC